MQEEEKTTTTTTNVADDQPVTTTRETAAVERSAPGSVLAKRVVYFIGGVIVALIGLRFIFLLLGANQGSAFVDFIYGLGGVFVAPFNGIFGEPTFGASYFETSSLVAIIIYALVAVGIGKLLSLNRPTA